MNPATPGDWNPGLYQNAHAFVWEYGRDLVPLLAPKPGECVLDLGCGTGQLTAEIAKSGADVIGIDRSPAMIEEARRNFPELRFEIGDATSLAYASDFEGVFSNAALHWIKDAEAVAAGVSRALKPGGRFVAEFGGHGNVRRLLEAVRDARASLGVPVPHDCNPWYFPTIGEYAALLERHGLEVTYAVLFDRVTPLQDGRAGLAKWLDMFGVELQQSAGPEWREKLLRRIEERAAPHLLKDSGWTVDYRRIRVIAERL